MACSCVVLSPCSALKKIQSEHVEMRGLLIKFDFGLSVSTERQPAIQPIFLLQEAASATLGGACALVIYLASEGMLVP